MAERSEHVLLNHLIETCRDGEHGFRHAAEQVKDPAVKALLLELASQRARLAAELLPHAQRLGGDAPGDGTRAAALHRSWMDLKGMLSGHSDAAIVAEAERGDSYTVSAYKEAVESMLPPESRDLIERQFAEVRQSFDKLRAAAS